VVACVPGWRSSQRRAPAGSACRCWPVWTSYRAARKSAAPPCPALRGPRSGPKGTSHRMPPGSAGTDLCQQLIRRGENRGVGFLMPEFADARVRRCQSSQMTDSADDTARNVPRNCPVRQSARGCRDRASPATMTVAGAGFSMPLPGQATTRTGATRRFPRRSRPEMKNARHWAGRFHQQIFGKRPSPGPA